MVKSMRIFIIIIIGFIPSNAYKHTEPTMAVFDRVAALKTQLKLQLKKTHSAPNVREVPLVDEYKDYEESHRIFTPIDSKDPRKEKYNLHALVTEPEPVIDEKEIYRQRKEDFPTQKPKPVKHMEPQKSKIMDLFYRRMYEVNIVNPILMCVDLLTPYLNGYRTNLTMTRTVNYTNGEVLRLVQLLTEDLNDFTSDEIEAVLYQISNMRIRLFQWDITAMKLIINVIIKQGSTKSSKGVRYTKSVVPKKICIPRDNAHPKDDGTECVGTWIA